MYKLTTYKYNAHIHQYLPYKTDEVDEETRKSIIEHFAGKPPSEGFYKHQLADSGLEFYSICGDLTGYLKANHQNPKSTNGKEDRTETTGSEEVQ
jgi:hypothetical protein